MMSDAHAVRGRGSIRDRAGISAGPRFVPLAHSGARAILAFLALTCSAEALADDRDWLADLRPAKVSVTAGALFPLFLIYEYPAPWAGVEVAWQTGRHAQLVANAGTSMIWIRGSQRSLFPLGLGLRVFPWERGPWLQLGLGTMPYVEHVGLELPERSASTVDFGAATAARLGVGVRIRGWNIGLGSDFNLGDFYENYTGPETRPWEYTFMAWVGVPVWKRSAP